jgi:hypothetical protein
LGKFAETLKTVKFVNTVFLQYTNGAKALGGLITNIKSLNVLDLK